MSYQGPMLWTLFACLTSSPPALPAAEWCAPWSTMGLPSATVRSCRSDSLAVRQEGPGPAARAAWANALVADGWRRAAIAEATEATASLTPMPEASMAGERWARADANLWVGWVDDGDLVAVTAVMVTP
jgi:hypothetical protein